MNLTEMICSYKLCIGAYMQHIYIKMKEIASESEED